MYSGIIISIFILGYFGYNYFQSREKNLEFLKNPKKNDVYCTKNSKGYYSTLKLDSISKDTIIFLQNDFEYYTAFELDELNKNENYSNKKISLNKKEVEKMYSQDNIISITRYNE